MAYRLIPPAPFTNGRIRTTLVQRELVASAHGFTRQYGLCPMTNPPNMMVCTGASTMTALLGPDLGDGQPRGTKTNQNSLQPLMGLLHYHSPKIWKAGHLLNADFGGSGTSNDNLTPLTSAANVAHSTFENHIRRMLYRCYQIDRAFPGDPEWYGVLYSVAVSPLTYANAPAVNDMHSYAYSHISLNYGFVKLPKFPAMGPAPSMAPPPPNTWAAVVLLGMNVDARLAALQNVTQPVFGPSPNIANWAVAPGGIAFSVEIHNEP